jgi:PKD repeat protein
VFKTDNHGEIEWSVGFSGTPGLSNWAQASSVKETSDGGYIVAGYATFEGQTGMVLLKTHSKGSGFDWKGIYMGYGAFDVIQTLDCGYAVAEGGRLIKILAERPLIARFQYSPNNPIIQESILFNATYSYDRNQDITSYSWDFDDGNISSTTNPIVSHRYDRSGAYNVSLTAEDAEGLNSTYSGLVNIPAGPPVARFEYSPNSPVFKESIIFNASSSYDRNQDIVSYLWNFDDANITSTTNPSIVHRYKNPGIYNVSLTVIDAEGLDSSYSIVVCAKNPTSLSISTSSPPVTAGYSMNITGTLLDSAGVSLMNETVDLFYAFTGIENWTPISSNCTDSLGNYYANWTPPAASYFMIKAVYAGNYTHVESNGNVTVCMLPYETQYIFSVESNSTISAMSYDNNNKTLSFMTTGKEGTFGYVKVTADKSLVTDIALLKVHVDDVEYNYTATEADQSWVVTFTYSHSVHLVKIELDYIIPEFQTSFLLVILLIVSIFLTAVRHKSPWHTRYRPRSVRCNFYNSPANYLMFGLYVKIDGDGQV